MNEIKQIKQIAPEWVKYIAQDECGIWYGYENKPQKALEANEWHPHLGRYCKIAERDWNDRWDSTLVKI